MPPFFTSIFVARKINQANMEKNITFDSLPMAVMELVEKVDLIINLLGAKIEKREEIPKYLNTENALAYLKRIGFSMSKSKLYKLTALKSIPVHKNGNTLLFLQEELDKWCEEQIQTDLNNKNHFYSLTRLSFSKENSKINYGRK